MLSMGPLHHHEPRAGEPEVYDYVDYRAYLKAVVDHRRASSKRISLRQIAAKVGIDHSLLTKVLQSSRHIPANAIAALAAWLKLDDPRAEYLDAMVAYARARSDEAVRKHYEDLLQRKPLERRRLEAAHYEYFQKWHHVAVRSLLDWYEFFGEDWEGLGARLVPPVPGQEARLSVDLLQRLGLVERTDSGRYVPSSAHLSTGDRWHSAAVRTFQREVIRLSEGAVDRIPKHQRDISTLTVALPRECLDEIREVLKEARSRIVKIADRKPAEESDAVYQLNIQWFPVSRLDGDPGNG